MDRAATLDFFITICRKPGMVMPHPTFVAVCTYIDGYDTGLMGAPLLGFREWLLMAEERWSNLDWWFLVRRRIDKTDALDDPPSVDEDLVLRAELASALDAFAAQLRQGGLGNIFREYHEWRIQTD